jgi:hypothetical protein
MHMHLNIASVAQPFSKDDSKKKISNSFLDC